MADVVRTRRRPPHFVRTRIDAWTTRCEPSSSAACWRAKTPNYISRCRLERLRRMLVSTSRSYNLAMKQSSARQAEAPL